MTNETTRGSSRTDCKRTATDPTDADGNSNTPPTADTRLLTDGGPPIDGRGIAAYGNRSLRDVVNGDLGVTDSCEYLGLHLVAQGPPGSHITVQADGYVGQIESLDPADYDDVLELVDDLNRTHVEWSSIQEHGDLDERVEYAGQRMTSDQQKAEDDPDHYTYIPEDAGASEEELEELFGGDA